MDDQSDEPSPGRPARVAQGRPCLLLPPEPRLPDNGQRGLDAIWVCIRHGPSRRQLLACSSCQARFCERTGAPLFDARLPDVEAASALLHIAEVAAGERPAASLA